MTGLEEDDRTVHAPLVSVILPTYNGDKYIAEALQSIIDQNADFEVIVCDDGSTDATAEIVSGFSDARVRFFPSQENLGIFGNLNRCLEYCRGRFVQIFSQDDVMLPGYLTSQAEILHHDPSVGLVYNSSIWINESGHVVGDQRTDETSDLISPSLYRWIASHYGALPTSISSVMFRREVIDVVGPFNQVFKVAGDVEFYNRVSEKYFIARNREPLHLVRSHREMTSARSPAAMKYLVEEALLCDWFRRQWSPSDWSRIQRFRSELRGTLHLKWMLRRLLGGDIGGFVAAARVFPAAYTFRHAIVSLVRQALNGPRFPTPYVPPPRGH